MKDLIRSLHPLERKVVPNLKNNITLKELAKSSKLQEVEAMRALQWLENKKVLKSEQNITEEISLSDLGKKYLKKGLPERRLLEEVKDKPLQIRELKLEKDELNIALGELKKKAAIQLGKEISITDQGKKLLEKETLEEKFLKSLKIINK